MNGQRFLSLGRLSAMFQRDAGEIADALEERGVSAEMFLDEIGYYPARAVAELRSHFQRKYHGQSPQ